MGKKKKYVKRSTSDFRNIAQVTMGAGMVGAMTPLMSNPSQGNLSGAAQSMVGFSILAPMASVGFDAIDRIGKKRK